MNWLVVCSKPCQESRAEFDLRRQQMQVYCPRIHRKACTEPLFRGYLFVRETDDPAQVRLISYSHGVRALLSVNNQPSTVTHEQIANIKSREQHGIFYPFKPGDEVKWGSMPAIFEGMVDDARCSVLFSMLGASHRKILNPSQLELC